MLKRKVYSDLIEWKNRKHNCLLIKGQRQVGKTFIVNAFGREYYKNVVELNFHEDKTIHSAFMSDLDVDTIIANLSIILNRSDIRPGETLLFFDEIQDCPEARSSLKNFSIDGRYDVIASGSLLGVEDSRLFKKEYERRGMLPPLLPVGYEEHIIMYGLDFEEFLWALGLDETITRNIRKQIAERRPFGDAMRENLMSKFREFMIVGGMPKCVSKYIVRRNPMDAEAPMKEIIDTIVSDINRYNDDNESLKTLACFHSIKNQLAETNKKYILSRIEDNGGSRASSEKYSKNLLWIQFSGVGNFCRGLTQPAKPLEANVDWRVFKIYLSDTGMLTNMYGNSARLAIIRKDNSFNQGAIMENEIAECLMKCGIEPRFFRKSGGKGQMELDFVMELGCDLTAVEVKSGKSRNTASLSKVNDFFNIDRRILLEDGDMMTDDEGIEHYPLFCAAFMDELIDEKYRDILNGKRAWFDPSDDSVFDGLR